MTDSTTGILDLIDAAVADWETGPDAVRYNTADVTERWEPGVEQVALERAALTIRQAAFTLSRQFVQVQTLMVPAVQQLAASVKASHAMMLSITKAFRINPWHLGHVGCFCHPAPFSAARDYRRRTRHRNRRRR